MPESEREPFQLGIFMPNCSHAYCISSYKPEPGDWPYESNKKIAQAAETAGFMPTASVAINPSPTTGRMSLIRISLRRPRPRALTFCFRSAAGAGLAARPIIWAPHSKP